MFDWAYPAAFVTGASLAVSGAVLQSVLRNPLAEPYLLGTVGGAATAAALAVNLGIAAIGSWSLAAASFLGSVFSLVLVAMVAMLASRARRLDGADAALRSSGNALVLAGFATAGFMGSLDMLIISYSSAENFKALSKWLFGSLASAESLSVYVAATVFVVSFGVVMASARRLNVLELGRDEAETLGVNTRFLMIVVLLTVSVLTAVSVALAGAVGFIGLVVPHFVRRLNGPRLQRVFVLSAIVGGLFLMVAERLRRCIPGDVPVGVVCALVGAPLFFVLLSSRRNGEGWDV